MACRLAGAIPLAEPMLLIEPLGANASDIAIEIHTFSFKKMHLKMSSGIYPSFCLGVKLLNSRMG